MHPDLHRYLDGEISRDVLPEDLADEAREWDELLGAASVEKVGAPPWLENRIMAALPVAGRGRRLWDWMLRPQTIELRPIAAVLAGGCAALAISWLRPDAAPPDPSVDRPVVAEARAVGATAETGAVVQFVFVSPGARSVALAGDFNGWDPELYPLRDADGDGVWTGFFTLPPGLHKYMFVVDGQQWVTDPHAERYVDDGFGMHNALITVTPAVARSS